MRRGRYVWLLLLGVLVPEGCVHPQPKTEIDSETMNAALLEVKEQNLVIAGKEYKVQVREKVQREDVEVELVHGNNVLEKEEYSDTPAAFSLLNAQEEWFQPSVPILKFPFSVGSSWSWNGLISESGKQQVADATIGSQRETLIEGKTAHNTIRIDVNFLLRQGPTRPPLRRRLQFWFEPGHGMLMRNFGDVSTRKPPNLGKSDG